LNEATAIFLVAACPLTVVVVWMVRGRTSVPSPIRAGKPRLALRRRWTIGFITGCCVGVGALLAGLPGAALGIVAILLLSSEPERDAPVGGLFVGGGVGWLAVFGAASTRCDIGCTSPDLTPWLAAALGMFAVGLLLTWRAVRADKRKARSSATVR
jgi:hypothetical protein